MAADSVEVPPICAAIRAGRETAGLTQDEVAQRVEGLTQKRMSTFENGREPQLDMIAALEEAIDPGRRRGWLLRAAGYVEDATTLERMIDSDPRLDARDRDTLKTLLRSITRS